MLQIIDLLYIKSKDQRNVEHWRATATVPDNRGTIIMRAQTAEKLDSISL
jgi:hypothetical protein